MAAAKKTSINKKRKQTPKWILAVSAALIIVIIAAAVHFSTTGNSSSAGNNAMTSKVDPAFVSFTTQFLDIMKNLNSTQTKTQMAQMLSPSYNQTDIFSWESSRLTFASDPSGSFVNPFQILNTEEGVCLQWSIVYVSACLALGYQSRLVVAVDTSGWSWIHVWAEDYYNGTWVHVDPSDKVWGDPHMYLGSSWGWGQYIGTTVKVYAFEDGKYLDVTSTYSA